MLNDFMCKVSNVNFDNHEFTFAIDYKYKLWVRIDKKYPELFEAFGSPEKETYASSSILSSLFLYGDNIKCKCEISHLIHFINYCQMELYIGIGKVIDKKEDISKDIIDILKNIDVSESFNADFEYNLYDNYKPYYSEVTNPFYDYDYNSYDMRLSVEKIRFITNVNILNDYVTEAYVDDIANNIYHTTMGYSYNYTPYKLLTVHKSTKRIFEFKRKSISDSDGNITDSNITKVFNNRMPRKLFNAIKVAKEISFDDLCKNYRYTNKHYVCIYDNTGKQYVYLNPYTFPMDRQDIYHTALLAVDRYGEKLINDDIVFVPHESNLKELVFISTDFIANYIHPLQYANKEKAYLEYMEENEGKVFRPTVFFNDMRNREISGVLLSVEASKVFFKATLKYKYFKVKAGYQQLPSDYDPGILNIKNSIRNYGYNINIKDGEVMFNHHHQSFFFQIMKEVIDEDPELSYRKSYIDEYGDKVVGIIDKRIAINIIEEMDELPGELISLLLKK